MTAPIAKGVSAANALLSAQPSGKPPLTGLSLRQAEAADALCLSVLAMQVFLDTYATQGIRPAVAREVLGTYAQAAFAAAIEHANTRIVVAERAGHLLGFAQVTLRAAQPLAPEGVQAELLRLYVQEPFTGARLGTRLLAAAQAVAATSGANVLWLTPWVHNHRAIAFYGKRGFHDCGQTWFTFEGESHENRVFAKAIGTPTNLQPAAWSLRPAHAGDAPDIAQVLIASRKALLPYAPWAHSDAEIAEWVASALLHRHVVTVAQVGSTVRGVVASIQKGATAWIEQLYIDPTHVGLGIGSALLTNALCQLPRPVRLYTFQQNERARQFYAARGFVEIALSDGAENEERCPDVLMELHEGKAAVSN